MTWTDLIVLRNPRTQQDTQDAAADRSVIGVGVLIPETLCRTGQSVF